MAINLAKSCDVPKEHGIPRVGAVIVDEAGDVLGVGWRGNSRDPGSDVHAEAQAIDMWKKCGEVTTRSILYTTLEPCTGIGLARSQQHESCADIIIRSGGIFKVYVGMLDPDDHITGKGIFQLQAHGIEVQLFPRDLMLQVSALNEKFILSKKVFVAKFVNPPAEITKESSLTTVNLILQANLAPATNIFLVVEHEGYFWPGAQPLRSGEPDHGALTCEYQVRAYIGDTRAETITFHIVAASESGLELIRYYHNVANKLSGIQGAPNCIGIPMQKLPKGIRSVASHTLRFKLQ